MSKKVQGARGRARKLRNRSHGVAPWRNPIQNAECAAHPKGGCFLEGVVVCLEVLCSLFLESQVKYMRRSQGNFFASTAALFHGVLHTLSVDGSLCLVPPGEGCFLVL